VRLHGSEVRVASQPGQGSAFTVILPRGHAHLPSDRVAAASTSATASVGVRSFAEDALGWLPGTEVPTDVFASPTSERGGSAPGARRFRIVLADDNADMRQYVTRLLRSQWDVEAVGDGRAALAALRERPADLLLADVMMPDLGGFELLRALRADPATHDVPVILLSARAGEESRVEGLEAGADDYVIKPFSARELVARVEAHLKMCRSPSSEPVRQRRPGHRAGAGSRPQSRRSRRTGRRWAGCV
jgi:CheY-like chemotaxis protein